jgi:RNA polymerase sigma-70 factor (ECF subfamily)
MVSTRSALEADIREAVERSDYKSAATLALDAYGLEVQRFLRARLRSGTQADDAYLAFSEDLWVGLPAFRWESSLRIWLFTLARNAGMRVGKRVRKEVALQTERGLPPDAIAGRARTATVRYLRTSIKDRMRELRERLDDDEQTLLILRVDRRLEWRELAMVMNEVTADASEEDLTRASARMRTRFQAAKRRLRALAQAAGLLDPTTRGEPD